MTAVIETHQLSKSYGPHRGIVEVDLDVEDRRGLRLPRAQRRRQDDDDPDAARSHPPDERPGDRVRHRDDCRPGRHPPTHRLPARRVRALRPAHRRPDARLLRQPARRRRGGLPGRPRRALRPGHVAQASASTPRATSRRSGSIVALQHRPELLILDEPTSGLDPLIQQEFYGSSARPRRRDGLSS